MARDSEFGSFLGRIGWTGGQYSVFRILLGAYLFAHFVQLTQWAWELFSYREMMLEAGQSPLLAAITNIFGLDDVSGLLVALSLAAAAASLLFIAGIADKWAAFFVCFALACLYGTDPLIGKQSVHYLGWMLLAHLLMPKAPYGSLVARGRPDPGGGWRLSAFLFAVSILILAFSHFFAAHSLLFGPNSEASTFFGHLWLDPFSREYFAQDFLAWLPAGAIESLVVISWILGNTFLWIAYIFERVRLWFWGVIFFVQFCIVFLLDLADPTVTMLLFHFFAFDPGWIRSRKLPEQATLFYDGSCALCHRLVRFVLAEDKYGRITLSPLQSEYFKVAFTAEQRIGLPHSSIVLKSDADLKFEADAAIRILKMLGGLWLLLALVLGAFPRRWRNAGYHFVGDRRYRIFGRTETACPIVPPNLRSRFKE